MLTRACRAWTSQRSDAAYVLYLLDTNIISDLMRNPQGAVSKRLAVVGEAAICTSVIVAAEVRYGVEKSGSPDLRKRAEAILQALPVLSFDAPADQSYARLRWYLARRGMIIGPNDMLIATQALAANQVLVSANVREFSRVPGLAIENWLE